MNMRKKIRIGTWNVQSLFEPEKSANMIQEARRINIDIDIGTCRDMVA